MSDVAVVHAPALAGGPLRLLNRVLQACGEACARSLEQGRPWRAVLVLDDGLTRQRDRALLLLNAFGDPVVLAGPGNGVYSAEERAAVAAAAHDLMPPTAEAAAVIERLLPAPGADPVAAAADLWRALLRDAGLHVRTLRPGEAAGEAPAAVIGDAPAEWSGTERVAPREATWFAPRHLQLLRQLQLPPSAALAGETMLRAAATPAEGGAVLQQARSLAAELDRRLGALEAAVAEDDPSLLGTGARLRRQTRAAVKDFLLRAERNARNRRGIRGARLHALAQALRPLDQAQEDHIGLLCAAALFRLDLDRLPAAIPRWAVAPRTGRLLLACDLTDM
ncbi:MAG: hypothetical protein EYC70_09260 [Planctomycetota bacterium]|nr:MAG: hypothetical protein EYC70_09260 [Planctomycetota bacterium]